MAEPELEPDSDKRAYLKIPGCQAEGDRGDIEDGWAVVSRDKDGNEEVVGYLDTERLADLLLSSLTGYHRSFNFAPNKEYS